MYCLNCGGEQNQYCEMKEKFRNAVLADVGERLLPCPFCGGEWIPYEEKGMLGDIYYFIRCRCCASESGWDKNPKGAPIMWNMRANVS